MAERIRELKSYAEDDDDTSVNIVAHPGSVVNVRASRPDSDAPSQAKDWKKLAAQIVGALVGLATVAKAIWEATR